MEAFFIQEIMNIIFRQGGRRVINQPILQIPNIRYDCFNAIFALVIRAVVRDTLRFAGTELAIDTLPLVFPRLRHSR